MDESVFLMGWMFCSNCPSPTIRKWKRSLLQKELKLFWWPYCQWNQRGSMLCLVFHIHCPYWKKNSYFGGIPGNYNQSKQTTTACSYPTPNHGLFERIPFTSETSLYWKCVCSFCSSKGVHTYWENIGLELSTSPLTWNIFITLQKAPGTIPPSMFWTRAYQIMGLVTGDDAGAPDRKPWLAYIAKTFRYFLAELQNSSPINRDIMISFWILTRLLKPCMYLYIYINNNINQKKTG